MRGSFAQGLFNQVGGLAQNDLQRMIQFATSFPSPGSSSRSHSAGGNTGFTT
jgi:hypothetical protein